MNTTYLKRLQTFTETDLPDLDEVVLGSLQFLDSASITHINVRAHRRPLVIGSVGGLNTARILFRNSDAVIADEGSYKDAYNQIPDIDSVYIVSASGSKHAVHIAADMKERDVPVYLITSTLDSPASAYIASERICVFPHIREPYTYNTSTYLGMLLGDSTESPGDIIRFIEEKVAPHLEGKFGGYDSFVCTVPPQFGLVRSMLETKFDEMFAPVVTGRAFTSEEIKHAKIVVPSDTQCFLNFGVPTTPYARNELQYSISLPKDCGYVGMLAIGYYVIGTIQKQKPPYFKDSIRAYTEHASEVFGQPVPVIVE